MIGPYRPFEFIDPPITYTYRGPYIYLQGQHVIAETRRLSAIELGICPGFGDHKRK